MPQDLGAARAAALASMHGLEEDFAVFMSLERQREMLARDRSQVLGVCGLRFGVEGWGLGLGVGAWGWGLGVCGRRFAVCGLRFAVCGLGAVVGGFGVWRFSVSPFRVSTARCSRASAARGVSFRHACAPVQHILNLDLEWIHILNPVRTLSKACYFIHAISYMMYHA